MLDRQKQVLKTQFFLDLIRLDLESALTIAIKKQSFTTAELLVRGGAEINKIDPKTQTCPLQIAFNTNDEKLISLLFSSPNLKLSSTDSTHFNPLFHCIKLGDFSKTRMIVNKIKAKETFVFWLNEDKVDPCFYVLQCIEEL